MTWRRLPLAFELLSPLHIGFLPNQAGTVVARTRCYVPGKNIWGAVVARLTPRLYSALNSGTFRTVGNTIRGAITFSYFYLADGGRLYTPQYGQKGLTWGECPDREFRARYIGAHVSTQISESGEAAHGTLHEIEFLRDQISLMIGYTERVLLAGVIWVQEGAAIEGKNLQLTDGSVFVDSHDLLQGLTLGGERNYGFGLVRRVPVGEVLKTQLGRLWPQTNPMETHPADSGALFSHLPYRYDYLFRGDIEVIAGREYQGQDSAPAFHRAGAHARNEGYWFAPGTRLAPINAERLARWTRLDSWGRLIWV